MVEKDLRETMEETSDKFSVLADPETFRTHKVTIGVFIEVVRKYLSDSEIVQLFELEHISQQSTYLKSKILNAIEDSELKMKVMGAIDIGLDKYHAMEIIKGFSDEVKIQVLRDAGFRDRFNLESYDIGNIIKSLSEANLISLLSEVDLVSQELDLMPYQLIEHISSIKSEDKRQEIMDMYTKGEKPKLETYYLRECVATFSAERKESIILTNMYGFDKAELECIMATLSVAELIDFLNGHKEFLEKNEISPHNVAALVKEEMQAEIVERIDDLDFSVKEKRLVLVSLKNRIKAQIDTSHMPAEYAKVISMQRGEALGDIGTFGNIIVDLNRDLEDYRDFDEYIVINPKRITEEEKARLLKLCEICPKIKITDDLGLTPSTAEEYISGEKWITQVLEGVNQNWSDIQKVAYIDNQIGKKISYTPDFGTEECDLESARALWRIIDSGYGVCNGIAQVEQYILGKLRNRV